MDDQPICIGFTGNRNGISESQKEGIISILNNYNHIVALHGDCVGSDTDFHNLCVANRAKNPNKVLKIHIYPPSYSGLRSFLKGDVVKAEKPFLKRNLDIIQDCSILIACPKDKNQEELRSGTWSTIRQARKQNKQIYIL